MEKIVIFGKGGIGKSTLSVNLAAVYAKQGRRVLLVGCDPKHDTTAALTGGEPIPTTTELPGFLDLKAAPEQFVVKGSFGIDCVEAGGPEPGIGCAGRGISRMIEILERCGLLAEQRYDAAIFDVLGDVVCGGFAAPLRQGFAEKVVIVLSEEMMALYAANNIARAVRTYAANGIALAGVVANLKDPETERELVQRFARRLGSRVLAFLPRDPAVRRAEYNGRTTVEEAPGSPFVRSVETLAASLWECRPRTLRIPTPLSDREFHRLSRRGFKGRSLPAALSPAPAQASRPTAAPGPDPAAPPEPAGLDCTLVAWAQAERGSNGGWADGPNALQWGAPEQWRNFFCDIETERNAFSELQARVPLVKVYHTDLECYYATPDFQDGLVSYFNFPWVPREAPALRAGVEDYVELTTDLRDGDAIGGGARKLEAALEAALECGKDRAAIVVGSTCVPTVIGDDVESTVARVQGRTQTPILFTNPAGNRELNMVEVFLKRAVEAAAGGPAEPAGANLFGFPEGPARDELGRLLERSGIPVHARLLPRLEPEEGKRLRREAVSILFPNPRYRSLYSGVLEAAGLRTAEVPAPFGPANTQRWLGEVARLCGEQARARETWQASWGAVAPEWERLRRAASGHRIAFVAGAEHVLRLGDPAGLSGIPLVALLKEMGFGIDLFVFGKPAGAAAGPGLHRVRWFQTPEELRALLAEEGPDAVYSEYFFDRRLSAAGKAQVSLNLFEMGTEGALRSLRRVLHLCRWPFYRKYGRYLAEPEHA